MTKGTSAFSAKSSMRRSASLTDLRESAQCGFRVLSEGRSAVTDFLVTAPWLKPNFDKARYEARCGDTTRVLQSVPSESLRTLITECLNTARVRNRVAVPSGRLARFDGEDGAWSLKSAATALSLMPKQLAKLLKALSLEPERCPRTRVHRLSAGQISAVRQYIAESHSARETADVLGCTVQDLEELVRRGTLESGFLSCGERYFQKAAIEAFIARALPPRTMGIEHEALTLCSFATSLDISLSEANSRIVRSGSISIIDYDEALPFFLGAKVAPATKTRARPTTRNRPGAQIRDAITFAEAEARLGTGSNGLIQLIELSYIKVAKDAAGHDRICEDSLLAFESAYVRAAAYAPLLECAPTSALKLLRRAGVQPINDCGRRNLEIVSRDDVRRLTGLELTSCTGLETMEMLRNRLAEVFVLRALPATVRIVVDPAITVLATSRRWAFRIEFRKETNCHRLIARFIAENEPARLKKIQAASIAPESIWPKATVEYEAQGGFIIVDEIDFGQGYGKEFEQLLQRIADRGHQLHRLL